MVLYNIARSTSLPGRHHLKYKIQFNCHVEKNALDTTFDFGDDHDDTRVHDTEGMSEDSVTEDADLVSHAMNAPCGECNSNGYCYIIVCYYIYYCTDRLES